MCFPKPLHLTYEAAQIDLPSPDVTLVLGEYQWKVHSELLESRSKFFKQALKPKSKKEATKQITLSNDDPWIIARLIQYLYINTCEISQIYEDLNDFDVERSSILDPDCIMKHNKQRAKDYNADRDADSHRTSLEILVMIIDTVDKYSMCSLISSLECVTAWDEVVEEFGPFQVVHALLGKVHWKRLVKYKSLKGLITGLVAQDAPLTRNPNIRSWYESDKEFALLLARKCADKISDYERRICKLKGELSKMEAENASKKRKRAD